MITSESFVVATTNTPSRCTSRGELSCSAALNFLAKHDTYMPGIQTLTVDRRGLLGIARLRPINNIDRFCQGPRDHPNRCTHVWHCPFLQATDIVDFTVSPCSERLCAVLITLDTVLRPVDALRPSAQRSSHVCICFNHRTSRSQLGTPKYPSVFLLRLHVYCIHTLHGIQVWDERVV